jgi:hypothetical protein
MTKFRELLPQAVDELEQRWRAGKLAPIDAVSFCDKLAGRLHAADAAYAKRVAAVRALAAADPKVIEAEVVELEELWPDFDDNYKDILEECEQMLVRTDAHPKLEARVLAVLSSVVDEVEREAKQDVTIRTYLGTYGTRKHWEAVAGKPLPKPRKR